MKKLYLLLVVFVASGTLWAQSGPKISFKTTEIDYGTVEKGDNGYRLIEFTNTGDAPLIISRVKSSCGCTVAEKPDKPVMPGQKGRIKVHYNTRHVGPFRKTVTIYSNAVNVPNGVVVVKIKGRVVDPEKINLDRPKPQSPVFR